MSGGGKREGAGRKPAPQNLKKHAFKPWVTDFENDMLVAYLEYLRRTFIKKEEKE